MVYTTLILTCFIVALVITLLLAISYKMTQKHFKGIRSWMVSVATNFVSLMGFLSVFSANHLYIIMISSILLVVSMFFLVIGIDRFLDKFRHHYDLYVLLLISTIYIVYFSMIAFDRSLLTAGLSFSIGYICLRGGINLIMPNHPIRYSNRLVLSMFIFLMSISSFVRGVNSFNVDVTMVDNLAINELDYVLIFIFYLSFTLLAVQFNLLINQRLLEKTSIEEMKFRAVFDKSPLAMMMGSYDKEVILDLNDEFIKQLGFSKEEMIGKKFNQLTIFDKLIKDKTLQAFLEEHSRLVNSEVPVYKKDGEIMHALLSVSTIHNKIDNFFVITLSDITKIHQLKEILHRYAHYDQLTELPNRRMFVKHFDQMKADQKSFVIATIDLDDFKKINDRFGHDMGDQVLKSIANRLKTHLDQNDLVARYGGDEFILILDYQDDLMLLEQKVKKMLELIQDEFEISGQKFNINSSAGYAIYNVHGTELKDLMKKADDAMYRIKNAGKNSIKKYEEIN